MTEKHWEFELDGVRHSVDLEHSTFSNKQTVRVGGRLLQAQMATAGRHGFPLQRHACELVVAKCDGKHPTTS